MIVRLSMLAAVALVVSASAATLENGVACTVNFGDRPFTMKDGYVLGPRSHRLERPTTGREVAVLSDGWEFSQDRQSWRSIRVPHDWGVESDFDMAKYDGENGALPWKGVGWYRRTLVLDNELNGRRMSLAFDGVLADGVCFVNGEVAGRGEYGYLGFTADMTDYLFKGTNTIIVKADTTKLRSRWYPGAGMFRPVRLVETDDVYLEKEDLVVTTPEVSSSEARLLVKGTVVDRRGTEMPLAVRVELADPNGNVVAASERSVNTVSWSKSGFEFDFKVSHPALWQMVDPAPLYTLRVSVKGQGVSDELSERVGFRSFRFEPDGGFFLNGRRGQIKGVNLHSDLGILGAAFDKSYARRQLKAMREMGANALRTSHNPPSPELLDLCDEMGVFVWDEAFDKWDSTSNRGEEPMEDFVSRNLRRFVRRDRNHPCVFVWSIGNEIPVGAGCAPGQQHWAGSPALGTSRERCALFRNAVREEDATRPVGIGSCDGKAVARGDYEPLDIVGWNYRGMYRPFRDKYPKKSAIYSESASAVSEFGWYSARLATNKTDYAISEKRVDSYDRNAAPWSDIPDIEFWRMEKDLDIGGEFVWTGTDYLGEPTPFNPHQAEWKGTPPEELARSSYFGINDLLHLPKDRTYLYRAHWRTDVLTLHIVPNHWNFDAGRRVPVYVYTSADEAELSLNGRSLGRRRKDKSATFDKNDYYGVTARYRLCWEDVPFESGELSCVAYDADGGRLGETAVRTAGEPAVVLLKPESDNLPSDGSLVFVRVSLGDANGVEVPGRRDRVSFSLVGPGEIVAVGNADPKGRRSFRKTDSYELFEGVAGIVLRRTGIGRVVLTARCGNMEQNALFY